MLPGIGGNVVQLDADDDAMWGLDGAGNILWRPAGSLFFVAVIGLIVFMVFAIGILVCRGLDATDIAVYFLAVTLRFPVLLLPLVLVLGRGTRVGRRRNRRKRSRSRMMQ